MSCSRFFPAMRRAILPLLAAVLACSGAWAAPSDHKVDSLKVHKLYLEGEFDAAIAILEGNLKSTRQYSHGDSVFIFKHLGVMYAAHEETREKGKYYMHRLLLVEPTAKIMDMYASDMIYMIFRNIQEEYEQARLTPGSRPRNASADPWTDAKPDAAGSRARESRRSGNGKAWLWAGAVAATVAVGIGAYVLLDDAPSTATEKEARF